MNGFLGLLHPTEARCRLPSHSTGTILEAFQGDVSAWCCVGATEQTGYAVRDGSLLLVGEVALFERARLQQSLNFGGRELSDGDLVLAAYARWGEAVAERIEGDFAFGIVDLARRRVFCARSPYSSAPLYYCNAPGRFGFASRARNLPYALGVPTRLDMRQFLRVLYREALRQSFGRDDGHVIAGVRTLPGGHSLLARCSSPHVSLHRFWSPRRNPAWPGRPQRVFDEVRQELVRCIERRIVAGRDHGLLLSGGLDSSALACLAAPRVRAARGELRGISHVPEDARRGLPGDEREFAEVVAAAAGLPMSWVTTRTGGDLGLSRAKLGFDLSEVPSLSPKAYVYEALLLEAQARGIETVFDGCFGEFGPTAHSWLVLGRESPFRCFAAGIRTLAGAEWSARGGRRVFRTFSQGLRRRPSRGGASCSPPLSAAAHERLKGWEETAKGSELTPASWEDVIEMLLHAPPAGTAFSGGPRVVYPFLDPRLIELCLRVPPSIYFYGGWNRGLIRFALQGVLPPEICWRESKAPFSPAYAEHVARALPGLLERVRGLERNHPGREVFDLDALERMLRSLTVQPGSSELDPELVRFKQVVFPALVGIEFLEWFAELPGS